MYTGRISLQTWDTGDSALVGRLRLNIRWIDDGSGLTPFPAVRTPAPDMVRADPAAATTFTVDDAASGRHEYVVTLADTRDDTLLFRSSLLQALPTVDAGGNGGFLVIQAMTAAGLDELNTATAAELPFTEDGTTITAATLAAQPGRDTFDLTASGTFGAGPVQVPFTYSASLVIAPSTDIFSPARICVTSTRDESLDIADVRLPVISHAVGSALRSIVEPRLDRMVDAAIRARVATLLGLDALPPTTTVTLQAFQPQRAEPGAFIVGALGGIGPFRPAQATGCALPVILLIGGGAASVGLLHGLLSS